MATSGSYNYVATASAIVSEAYRKIGALGDNETLDSARQAIGMVMLNMMVKTFASFGLQLWLRNQETIPLSLFSSGPVITVGPGGTFALDYKPLRLLECQRVDSINPTDLISVPMYKMSEKEYQQQPSKLTQGTPTQFVFHPDAYISSLSIWPNADTYWQTNGSLSCIFHRPVQDFDATADNPDFPPEWTEALVYQLATRLAPNVGLPPNDRMALEKDADKILGLVLSYDQEDASILIRPSRRYF